MQPPHPTPAKAKSRLSAAQEVAVSLTARSEDTPQLSPDYAKFSHHSHPKVKKLGQRARFVPLLIFSLVCYGSLAYVFTHIRPQAVANVLVFHSYLPILILFFLANFFLCSFLFLHTRRAAIGSVCLTLLLFLKLQSVDLTILICITVLVVGAITELFSSFIFKK